MSHPAQLIPDLTPITSFSHFRTPLAEGESSNPDDPQLIMIFGWVDARLTHVLHYSRMYAKIYPLVPQVIVECDMTALSIGTYSGNITRMHPVVKQLEKLGLFTDTSGKILIHTLSNGMFAFTLHAWWDNPTFLILDSSPGVGDYTEFLKSSTFVRRAQLVYLANRVLAAIHLRPQLRKFILDFTEVFDHSNPNKDTVFQPMHPSIPRLYLYSDADTIVMETSVRGHIARVRTAGVWVNEEYFRGSPHVMHARMYPEVYWTAVKRCWDAVERGQGGDWTIIAGGSPFMTSCLEDV